MNENLNKKLLELQRSVRALGKNADGFGYQYVSGSKLLFFIRPKMDELGLRLVPNTISVEQNVVETSPEGVNRDGSIKPAKKEVLVCLHKQFTWVDVDSGETETTDFYSQGCNGWDKAIGSAETYAERYFLLKYFHIATDEDDVDAIVREDQPAAQEQPEPKKKGKGKKAEAPVAPQPEVKEETSPIAHSLEEAVNLARDADSADRLVAIWAANKDNYGSEPNFVMAISSNPNNPKKR